MTDQYTKWMMCLRRVGTVLVVNVLLVAWSFLLPPFVREASAGTPVTLTITRVRCIDPCRNEGLEAAGESWPDFYAKVDINGVVTQTPRVDDDGDIHPNWVISADIPTTQKSFGVTIQIWDYDSTSGDDLGDASPVVGKNNLDLTVDRVTGTWTGDMKSDVASVEQCAHGGNPGGEPAVEVATKLADLRTLMAMDCSMTGKRMDWMPTATAQLT